MPDCIGQNTLELISLRQSLEASLENVTFFKGTWTLHAKINSGLCGARARILLSSLVFSTPQISMEIESV